MILTILQLLRNLFLRMFVIGFGLIVLAAIVLFGFWDHWLHLLVDRWHFVSQRDIIATLILNWFTEMRVLVGFGFLVPGLALHWTVKRLEAGGS